VFRWRSLDLPASESIFQWLVPVTGCFQALERLCFRRSQTERNVSEAAFQLFGSLKKLKTVEVWRDSHNKIDLPWSGIKELRIHVPNVISMIQSANRATVCHITLDKPIKVQDPPIVFPHILELYISNSREANCDSARALKTISLPALKHLSVDISSCMALEVVSNFLIRSRCPLETVTCRLDSMVPDLSDEDVETFLRGFPDSLVSCAFEKVYARTALTIMRAIASSQNLLPNLKNLRLNNCSPVGKLESRKSLEESRPHLFIESLW
jgi:hypothetical protein